MSHKLKRPRQTQDEGFCSMSMDEAGPSQRGSQALDESYDQSLSVSHHESSGSFAGIIKKLTLKNFMCHSHLDFEFNLKTNFIIGRNGSGKSAVQTAICIALGAKASVTNRAASLKKLIKTGCTQSSIELVLNNTGERAFKESVYGRQITVSRTINDSGANSFRLKDERGLVISTKKDELESLLSYLQIQIANPIAILNQDTARTFFSSTDPKKMYRLFVEATQIDEMKRLFKQIDDNRATIQDYIRRREGEKDTLEEQVRELERKVVILERAQNYKNKKDSLEEEILWARVHKCHKEVEESQTKLMNQNSQVEQLQEVIAEKSQEEEKIKEKIAQLQEILATHETREKEHQEAYKKAKDKFRSMKTIYDRKHTEQESFNRDYKRKQSDLAVVQEGILRLESSATQNNDRLLENRRKRAELEESMQSLNLAMTEAERERSVLRNTENDKKNRLSNVSDSIRQLENERRNLNGQLNNLQNAQDTLNIYAPYMQRLVERIDQAFARNQFKKKPKGPFGRYIKVKADASWGPAIENYLSMQSLRGFLVDNSADNHMLVKIMKEVCVRESRPEIFTSSFTNKLYEQVHRNETRYQDHQSIFSALEISDPDIANSLIDQKSIESVLLIEDSKLIARLLENPSTVPRNCNRCINKLCDQYYPAPNYKSYSGMDPRKHHRSQMLQVSVTDARILVEEQIRDVEERIQSLQNDLRRLQSEVTENRKQMKYWSDLHDSKRREIASLKNQISSLNEETDSEEYRLPILKGEAATFENELSEIDSKLSSLKEEIRRMKTELESVTVECKELQKPLDDGDNSNIQGKLEAKRDALKDLLIEKKRLDRSVIEATQKVSLLGSKVKACEEEELKQRRAAEEICEERETRDVAEIEQEWKEAKKYIETVNSQMGASYEEMLVAKAQREKDFSKLERGLLKLHELCHNYGNLIETRKIMFSRFVDFTSADVKMHFQTVLHMRHYKGRVVIDHSSLEIKLKVVPTDGGTKSVETSSLSGGERSYSAVAFIMALWKATDIPFYSMDEFDVFMDKVNRSYIIELLTIVAKHKTKCQFIFLTPQDTSGVKPTNDLSLFQMPDPERTSGSSSLSQV